MNASYLVRVLPPGLPRPGHIRKLRNMIRLYIESTNQFGSILEAREPPRIMQEPFKSIMVDIILQFRQQTSDEIANKNHLGFKGTESGKKD